jgi:predicted nucleic acid-binding protein
MNAMDQIVADASVIIKLFKKEVNTDKAKELLYTMISGKAEFFEPTILLYEVINNLRYSKFDMEGIKTIIKSLENFSFNYPDLDSELANKAAETAIKYNISFYDAVYVALALTVGAKFYTADEKLIRAVNLPMMKHIKDFE